ncbi:hypothetical protein BGX38DRAFT_1153902 [Terfezia claveryi]|nr:hypothetical protein BGX38DRAFT_1153902 [Terfezia claveryi]
MPKLPLLGSQLTLFFSSSRSITWPIDILASTKIQQHIFFLFFFLQPLGISSDTYRASSYYSPEHSTTKLNCGNRHRSLSQILDILSVRIQ